MTTPESYAALMAEFEALFALPLTRRGERLAELRARDPAGAVQLERMLSAAEASSALDRETVGAQLTRALRQDPAPRPLPAALGEVIGGYRLVSVIGRGGMGTVYLGEHEILDRKAAIKVLDAELAANQAFASRFLSEARIVNEVRHPHIVDIFDFVHTVEPARVACVMELLDGRTLSALIASAPLSLAAATTLCLQLCDALAAVHARGVVHRDLKPDNVMVLHGARLKVLDFGIAKIIGTAAGPETARGMILGTPNYMAPEQLAAEPVSAAADVYAVGEILFEMITGVRVFGGSGLELLSHKVSDAPALPALPEDVPACARVLALVSACLRKRPELRPSLEDVRAELEALVGVPDAARPARTLALAPHSVATAPLTRPAPAPARSWLGFVVVALGLVALLLAAPRVQAALERRAREAEAQRAWASVRAVAADPAQRVAARAVARAFADAPERRGTAAAFEARMAEGALVDVAPTWYDGALDARPLSAWTTAIQETDDPALRVRGLLHIARWLADNDRARHLGPLVEALEREGAPESTVVPLRLEWAVYSGHVDAAQAAYARALALGLPEARAFAPPDRLPRWLERGRWVTDIPFRATVVYGRVGGEPALAFGRAGAPPDTAVSLRPGARALDAAAFVPEAIISARPYAWSADADLDGDGQPETYGAEYGVGLWRSEGDARVPQGPEQGVPVTTDIFGIAAADLDGDGRTELVVGGGEWHTCDVRVLGADRSGALHLRARDHRGTTSRITTMPDPWQPGRALIVSSETDMYPNRRVYGPSGRGPRGALVVRALEGGELVRRAVVERELLLQEVVDLEADGTGEIMLGALTQPMPDVIDRDEGLMVLWADRERPGHFLRAFAPLSAETKAVELDGDREPELIALVVGSDRTAAWVIGDGDDLVPMRPFEGAGRDLSPAALGDAELQGAWDALRTISRTGLLVPAAEGLERLGRVADAPAARAAYREAAELWAATDHPRRSAEAWARAAELSRDPADGRRVVEGWLRAVEPGRAVEAARRWGVADEVVRAWVDVAGGATAGAELQGRLQIEAPQSVSLRTDEVRIDHRGGGPVAVLPLSGGDGAIAATAELRLDVAEWASGLELELHAGAVRAAVHVGITGGGGYDNLRVGCIIGDRELRRSVPLDRLSTPVVRAGLSWSPRLGRWRCHLAIPEVGAEWILEDARRVAAGAERRLVIAGASYGDMWMSAGLRDLEVWGATASPLAEPRHRAALALAEGRARDALALLAPRDHLARAIAHVRLGQLDAAAAELAQVAADPARRADARFLLKVGQGLWAPLARSALGEEAYLALFDEAWRDAPEQAAYTRRALVEGLEGIDLDARPTLAARRALVGLELGEAARGGAAAEAWLRRFDMLPEAVGGDVREWASRLHRALADRAAARGDVSAAVAHAEASVRVAPSPEIARDRLEILPSWPVLREHLR